MCITALLVRMVDKASEQQRQTLLQQVVPQPASPLLFNYSRSLSLYCLMLLCCSCNQAPSLSLCSSLFWRV
jgi:hypothetical protein